MVRANQTAAFPISARATGENRQLVSQCWHDCGFVFGEGLPTLQQKGGYGAHTDRVYGCPYAARCGIVSMTKWPLGQLNAFRGQSWCLRWANPK